MLELSGSPYCGGSLFLMFFISLSGNFIVGYYIDSSVFLGYFFPISSFSLHLCILSSGRFLKFSPPIWFFFNI